MKPIYTAVLFASLAVPGATLGAALGLPNASATEEGGGTAGRTPDQVLDMMAYKSNLSEGQKAQSKPISVDRQQKLVAFKATPRCVRERKDKN